ncbi:MAG: hypothetical protein JSR77_16795 [Planctomycetes bacterium]|nr:hypothetical protein [Planctomycetota bacterium]
MNTIRLSVVALAAAAGLAHAGDPCTAVWHGLPDFDQRRGPGLDLQNNYHLGLIGNGSSHCAPTSAMNMLGFIANNGYPQVMDGPRDWSSQQNYWFATDALRNLGNAMGTTVDGGTGFSGWKNAMQDWLEQVAPEQFSVGIQAYDGNSNPISPQAIAFKMQNGSLVSICYGRYAPDPSIPFVRERVGGHCCTVRHVYNGCNTVPEMGLRNPDNQSSLVTQSFSDLSVSDCTPTSGGFQPSDTSNSTYIWTKVYRFTDFSPTSSTYRMLDGACWVTPNFGLDVEVQLDADAGINVMHPVRLTDGINPTHTHTLPGVGTVNGLKISPDHTTAFIRAQGTRTAPPSVWAMNIVDGSAERILMTTSGEGPMTTSRFGDLYVADGTALIRVKPDRDAPNPGCTLPLPPLDIAYDDSSDRVVVCGQITGGGVQLGFVNRDVANPNTHFHPLPGGLNISGRPHVVVDPVGGVWLSSEGSTSVYRLEFEITATGGGTWQTREHILLARQVGTVQPTSGGSLLYTSGGVARQLSRNAAGGWSETSTSPFAGHPASPLFQMSLGRYGNDDSIATHITPSDESELPGQRDCQADFNRDGGVDGADVDAFFASWSAGDDEADVNADGGVDGADVGAFFEQWERGGC